MLTLLNILGFIKGNARYIVTGLAVLVLLIAIGATYRSCSRPAKLDEAAIQKAQDAIAKNDRVKMLEVLAESDTKEDAIDSNLKQIEIDRERAKKNYIDKTNAELAAELERRARQ